MATKVPENRVSTPVFTTSLRTYDSVIKASSTRKTASPQLKAFVARGKAPVKAR